MNNTIKKENIFYKFSNFLRQKFKIIIIFLIFILLLLASIQYFFYYQNNKILKISIEYNNIFSDISNIDLENKFKVISKKNNIYGTLASLEEIKIQLNNDDIERAFNNYKGILDDKNLDKIYQSAIALHASYSLLNKLNSTNNHNLDIYNKTNEILKYIDSSIDSYTGNRLEILYLLSLIKKNNLSGNDINNKSNTLYKDIQENDIIHPDIKDRVKKIHEFHKYK